MELELNTEQLLPLVSMDSFSMTRDIKVMPRNKKEVWREYGNNARVHYCAGFISISSLLWGYSLSALNVCIVPDVIGSVLNDIKLTTSEQETATALVLVGALFSALTSSGISEQIGQKQTIVWNNNLYIIGSLLCAFATSKQMIYFSRLLFGLACGIVTNTTPILLNEISPSSCRGQITTYFQLAITIGMFMSAILGYILVDHVPSGWRYLNGFIIVPATSQILLAKWIPESPWWLMQNKRLEDSLSVLKYLREPAAFEHIENELKEIKEAVEARYQEPHVGWNDIWQYKRCLIIGSIMIFFQGMTGINTVMLYSAKIFHYAGVNNPFLATTIVSCVNVTMAIVASKVVDTYGRRSLLLCGVTIMIFALLSLSTSLLYLNSFLTVQVTIAVIAVLVFVGAFTVSLGAVVWVVLADITPVHIRSKAFALFLGIGYTCNIIIATYTLTVINMLGKGHANPEKYGIGKLYFLLSGVSIVCFLFISCCLPETKGGDDSNRKK